MWNIKTYEQMNTIKQIDRYKEEIGGVEGVK